MDGAFCDFTEEERMEYLEKLKFNGVRNIEMESLAFAALTHHAGIKAAVVCVTLLDRLKGDQVKSYKNVDSFHFNFWYLQKYITGEWLEMFS